MGIFNKKNIIKLAEDDLNDARLSSQDFADDATKKRAFIDVLGARLAMKSLFSKKIEANNLYSMYTIQNVLGHIDIADIYFNNVKIDVRLVFNENEIFIPKSQFRYNILPDLYLVLALQDDLSSAEMLGFFTPGELDKNKANEDFYFYEKENLQKPEDLKKFLNVFSAENTYVSSEDDTQRAEALFLASIDNEISENERSFLFQQLAYNFELREKFVELENFELMSHQSAKEETISTDGVLGIIGSPETEEEKENSDLDTIIFDDNEETQSESDMEQKLAEGLINGAIVAGGAALAAGAIGALAAGSASAINSTAGAATIGAGTLAAGELAKGIASIGESINLNSASSFENEEIAIDEILQPEIDELESLVEEPEAKIEELELLTEDSEPEELEFNVKESEAEFTVEETEFKAEELDFEVEEPEANPEESLPVVDESEFKVEELDFEVEEPEVELEEPPFIVDEPQFAGEELDFEIEKPETEEPELVLDENEFKLDELDFEIKDPELTESEMTENKQEAQELELITEEPVIETVAEFNPIEPVASTSFEELAPLGDLPELGNLDELQPLEPQEALASIEEIAPIEHTEQRQEDSIPQDDVVDLENFDFGMFEDEKKEDSPVADEHSTEESIVSFDSLMSEPIAEKEEEIEYPKEDLVEVADSEIDETQEDKEIRNLTAQVDEILNQAGLTEEQKRALAKEIVIENDEPAPAEEEQIEQTPALAAHEAFAELNELNPTPDTDAEEQDLLKALFKKENISPDDEIEMGPRSTPEAEAAKKKKIIIAASVAGVMLVSLVAGGIAVGGKKDSSAFPDQMNNSAISANVPQPNQDLSGMPAGDPTNQPPQGRDSLTERITGEGPKYAPQPNRDMGQAVSEAFMSEPVNASVSKVAWEVPEELAYNDNFRKYLQSAGKNLKLTLQNDLLLSTELAYSNKMILDLTLTRDGGLQSSNVVVSSGSKQIDGIVLQSVKETLKYLKMPTSEVNSPTVTATLIINF